MINGSPLNVLDYGADSTGSTDCAAAFNAAIAALPSGGAIYVPTGTYKIATTVTLDDDITIFGDGETSVISSFTSGALDNLSNGTFAAVSKSNITLRGLNFVCGSNDGLRVKFVLSDNILIADSYFDGYLPDTNIMSVVLYIGGSTNTKVLNCQFKDIRDAVYLCRDNHATGTDSNEVYVESSLFYHIHHGTTHQYPTGVYVYYCKKSYVNNCTFKNIKPSTNVPTYYSYGVYEGDGAADLLSVSTCTFIDDDGLTLGSNHGILISTADSASILSCSFYGPLRPIMGTGVNTVCDGNTCFNTYGSNLSKQSSSPTLGTYILSNNVFANITGVPVQFGGNGYGNHKTVSCIGNSFYNSSYGALVIEESDYVEIIGNVISECNTAGGTGRNHCGITLYGPTEGLISDNSVKNVTTGLAEYGVWMPSPSASNVVVTPTNSFKGMVTNGVANARSSAPSTGTWAQGSRFWYWDAITSGGVEGAICVTAGTPGTWKNFGVIS